MLRRLLAQALALLITMAALASCATIPEGRSAVDAVELHGTSGVDADDVTFRLATEASPKFLGLFRGVIYEYEIFDRSALQKDLARVERYYRARGYYSAQVHAGEVIPTSRDHVKVTIVVDQGLPVLNRGLTIEGVSAVPSNIVADIASAARKKLPEGEPFAEDDFQGAEAAARKALTDEGYAYAKVERDVFLDIVHRVADVKLTITPDTPARFGKITIVGLDPDGKDGPRPQEIPEAPLRRAINIEQGERYSSAAVDTAKQSLLDLEVFSAVDIVPDLPDPPPASHVVPLTVKLEPSKLRQLRLGGGLEFDEIKTDLHLLAGWEDHNFLGGLRDLTVDFKPGGVLYPVRINNLVQPTQVLPEERLQLQFKQPGFLEPRTNAFVRPALNVYPLLVKTNPGADDPVVGYVEFKGALGVDRVFGKLYVNLSYNAQVEDPFSYKGPLDPALEGNTLFISYPDLRLQLDLRDDQVKPHKGIFLANDLQVAGGPFGGTATDVKVQPEIRGYIPITRRITFASRASVGFLFPSNYGDAVENRPTRTVDTYADVRDLETVFFRGFFSGGASSNRGFPVRGVSPYGLVPFLNPATAQQQIGSGCDPANAANNTPACYSPTGGFTLWEFSNEFRFNISGPFSASTFCDMSDVSPRPANIRLDHLHLSCGVGARYDTPVGPVRLDIGYRIQPLQVLGFASQADAANPAKGGNPSEGIQPDLFDVFPIGIAFGIGEAY